MKKNYVNREQEINLREKQLKSIEKEIKAFRYGSLTCILAALLFMIVGLFLKGPGYGLALFLLCISAMLARCANTSIKKQKETQKELEVWKNATHLD